MKSKGIDSAAFVCVMTQQREKWINENDNLVTSVWMLQMIYNSAANRTEKLMTDWVNYLSVLLSLFLVSYINAYITVKLCCKWFI